MVLLLYCNGLPRAANAGARRAATGLECRVRGPEGGPRSATGWSPRSLRERVRPEVRLETPPRMSAGRATASGHRAVLKHEAKCWGDMDGRNDNGGVEAGEGSHQHIVRLRHGPRHCDGRMVVGVDFDIVPTVQANGNKPISLLSVAAEPRVCVSKELQLGRRLINILPPDILGVPARRAAIAAPARSAECSRSAKQPSRQLLEA